eukprot:TRINITY_DN15041_c0_g2_i1.p1 TRINITY_DN15041_c0_g2~~TRINITY_DN15041_c0_g2_i1.p1  ORF type:complete len:576 (-),score=62.18 TRINITY_DN15041_c0_g2_i1:34-1668(-)
MRSFFLAVFAPEGWPEWVAPEYGRYQLWDTIQQVTFFVNTVISKQAVMKFHGVGDPNKTPAEATALEIGRGLLASAVALIVATPGMIGQYKRSPRVFRMASEMFNAFGHFLEILAAIFTAIVSLLYAGPMICTIAGTMSGAVRSVILQHFARGGNLPPGQDPDFGDISLKESNQDKAGKIVGLCCGIAMLFFCIGLPSTPAEEASSLQRSICFFGILTVVHMLGNVKAVLQLRIKPAMAPKADASKDVSEAHVQSVSFFRRMFLPQGYPHTVVSSYSRYRAFCLLDSFMGYPKQCITSMLFWTNVYGVGNVSSTPVHAVMIDIFMSCVDCVIGLLVGLPCVARALDFSDTRWFLRGCLLGKVAEVLQLFASLSPGPAFFPLIALARTLAAAAGTSSSRVNGAIPNALMIKEHVERGSIALINVNVAAGNQAKLASFPSGLLSICFLYYVVFTGAKIGMGANLMCYAALQVVSLISVCGQYRNLPPLPGDVKETSLADALVQRQVSLGSDASVAEQEDMRANMLSSYSGTAVGIPTEIAGQTARP